MKIILGADHGGYHMKERHKKLLQAQGHTILDAGALTYDEQDDFPDFVAQAVLLWRQQRESKIILWCRSGVGMTIASNRYPDIYCGWGMTVEQVRQATAHNHLNALALASDYLDFETQINLINAFLTQKTDNDEKFQRRRQKIKQLV